ncbi:MAG: CdaR family protein, partial [Clostridiales bacterium]|nr:CdaR family protein [Clostridiales bacterium]
SEENGVISLAKGGKLVRYLDEKQLRETLLHDLDPEKPAQHFWKTWKKKKDKKGDLLYFRLGALFLAVLLWFYVGQFRNTPTESNYTVPVQLRNLAADLCVSEELYQVSVRVKGSDRAMEELSPMDIHAYVDLNGLGPGEHNPQVTISPLPEGVLLVSVSPLSLPVLIEPMETRTFDLSVVVVYSEPSPPGYNRSDPVVFITKVDISGPAKYLNEIDRVFVAISIEASMTTYTRHLPVQVVDEKGNAITHRFIISPSVVEATVMVTTDQPDKTVAVNPHVQGKPMPGYVLTGVQVEPGAVKVYGEWSKLLNLLSVSTEAIDINGANQNMLRTVEIVVGDGISLGEVTKVAVLISIEPVEEKTFDNIAVAVRGRPADEDAEWEFGEELFVSVTISGAASAVAKLRAEDIRVYLDLYDLPPGEHFVRLSVGSLPNIAAESVTVTPQSITVIVTVPEPPGEEDAP